MSTRLRTVCSYFLLSHVILFIQCRNYGRTFLKFTLCGKKFSRQYRNRKEKGRRHYTTGKVVCTCVSDFQLMLYPYLRSCILNFIFIKYCTSAREMWSKCRAYASWARSYSSFTDQAQFSDISFKFTFYGCPIYFLIYCTVPQSYTIMVLFFQLSSCKQSYVWRMIIITSMDMANIKEYVTFHIS